MEITKDWEIKLIEEARKIVGHGFGKGDITVSSNNKLDTKVVIWAGCSYLFIIKREIALDKLNIV